MIKLVMLSLLSLMIGWFLLLWLLPLMMRLLNLLQVSGYMRLHRGDVLSSTRQRFRQKVALPKGVTTSFLNLLLQLLSFLTTQFDEFFSFLEKTGRGGMVTNNRFEGALGDLLLSLHLLGQPGRRI
jgi:hypothetical protein